MNPSGNENDDGDPVRITTIDELAAQLRRLRLRAGNPALREIERESRRHGRPLPRSTLAAVLAGQRAPRREVLLTLISTLGVADTEIPSWIACWEHAIEHAASKSADGDRDDEAGATRTVGYPLADGEATDSVWRFAEDHPVTLVCSKVPGNTSYADPANPDYVELLTYGDPDALLHLYGHVRALNPNLEVRFSTTSGLRADDYETHLAILGGTDFNSLTRHMMSSAQLPVRMPLRRSDSEWPGLEVESDGVLTRYDPVFDESHGKQVLREDLALFFRGPNPFNAKCTVTICAGIFARGTLAAVRCLTDPILGPANEVCLQERFADRRHFGFVARAVIVDGVVIPPDLNVEGNILYEWST